MENQERRALKAQVQRRYELLAPYLNEQLRRAWAAAEALTLGRGGNAIVAEAIGISRTTLTKAKHEVLSPSEVPSRQRRPGGGRKFLAETDEGLLDALDALIDPSTRGRSGVAVTVDVQEYLPVGGGVKRAGASDQSAHGVSALGGAGL